MIKFFKKLFSRKPKKQIIFIANDGSYILDVIESQSSEYGCCFYDSRGFKYWVILYQNGKTSYTDCSWKPHKGF